MTFEQWLETWWHPTSLTPEVTRYVRLCMQLAWRASREHAAIDALHAAMTAPTEQTDDYAEHEWRMKL